MPSWREWRFSEIVSSAISHTTHWNKINIWSFYLVPELDSWVSDRGRVVILGDVAPCYSSHCMTGVNQAMQMSTLSPSSYQARRRKSNMNSWLPGKITARNWSILNAQIDVLRVARVHAILTERKFELKWLYKLDFDEMVKGWIAEC